VDGCSYTRFFWSVAVPLSGAIIGSAVPHWRRLHARLVDLLREHHRDRLDENAALLAHHLEQARLVADAAAWHARAAEWVERRDVSEGMRHWRRVIEIEEGLPQPDRDGDLHARAYAGGLHLCWRMGLSRDETREALERGLAVADRIGSPRLRAKMLIPYAVICGVCGDERERIRWSREALELARSQGDRELEISARVPLATHEKLEQKVIDYLALWEAGKYREEMFRISSLDDGVYFLRTSSIDDIGNSFNPEKSKRMVFKTESENLFVFDDVKEF